MDAVPRGANFARIKLLWEIGVHVAADPSARGTNNRDMCIMVGSGSGDKFQPSLRMATGSPQLASDVARGRTGFIHHESIESADPSLSRHRNVCRTAGGASDCQLSFLGPFRPGDSPAHGTSVRSPSSKSDALRCGFPRVEIRPMQHEF